MPLENYGQVLEQLRREEEERLIRERNAAREATAFTAQPDFDSGIIDSPDANQYYEQAKQFLLDNPAPKASKLQNIASLLGRASDRLSGRQVRDWYKPDDPFAQLRDKVAGAIVTEGIRGDRQVGIEQYKERGRNKRQDKDFSFRREMKNTPDAMHPVDVELKKGQTLSPTERMARERGAVYDAGLKGQQFQRGQISAPLYRANVQEELNEYGQGGQPTPIQQPQEETVDSIIANNPPNRAIEILKAKGYPVNYMSQGQGQFGNVEADMGSTAEAPVQPTAEPANVQQMLQRNNPLGQMRRDRTITMSDDGGLTITTKKVLTPEAELAKKQQEAQIQHDYSSPGEETLKRFELITQAMNTTKMIARDTRDEDIGPLANAFGEYRKYAGQLSPQHERLRANIMSLNNLVGYIKSGANITVTEQDMNEHILPSLWSGNPVYFRNALAQVQNELAERMRLMGKLQGANRASLGRVAEEQINAPVPSLGQSTVQGQPANYPKGAPPGLVEIAPGKWADPKTIRK